MVFTSRRYFRIARVALAMIAGLALADSASAQGLFDFMFGKGFRRQAPPAQTHSFADPFDQSYRGQEGVPPRSGPHVAYCVRLCDGRYFPLQQQSGVAPAEICRSFCPAAKTKIFSGSGIEGAVAPDGARYADLDKAYAYRDKLVPDCSCNGKPLGLARVNVKSDPTLRHGDIVATNDGMMAVKASRRGAAEFTPVDSSAVSADMRRKLSDLKIAPRHASGESSEDAAENERSGRKAN